MRKREKKNESILLNEEFFKPKSMFWISKVYLLVGSVLHVNCIFLYLYTKMNILALVSFLYIVGFMTCFFLFKHERIRTIYTLITCAIGFYVILHVIIFGWRYNFFMYSFMMIPLCILTCISPREKEYNVKYSLGLFAITQGILLALRIYYLVNPIEPLYVFDGKYDIAYRIEGIIVYATSAVASFVPVFGFLLDLNNAYARIERYSSMLKYKATHDPLTKLVNRASINEKMDEAFNAFTKDNKVFSVIMTDIDDFKKINDTYGHNAGDVVLKEIAEIMTKTVDNDDCICRWGGEEILVLTYSECDKAAKLAEKIRNNIEKHVFESDNDKIKATVTLGVAQIKEKYEINELISAADDKLYIGKRGTKNCVMV